MPSKLCLSPGGPGSLPARLLLRGSSSTPYLGEILAGAYEDLFVSWHIDDGSSQNAYLRRVSPYGNSMFQDVVLGPASSNQQDVLLIPGADLGVIAAWQDERSLPIDLYGQCITQTGYWGDPGAALDSVTDVPNDQGGFVSMNWFASRLDGFPNNQVFAYTLWRSLPPGKSAAGGTILDDPSQVSPDMKKPVYLRAPNAEKVDFWEYLSTADAFGLPAYGSVQGTPFDSTAIYDLPINYMVITHTQADSVFFMSAPAFGWSVDNLAPGPVKGLRGTVSYGPSSVDLAWHPNTEADLDHYNLYRGATPGFIPDAGSLVSAVSDTTFLDNQGDGSSYYRLTAVDIHGNEGPDVLLSPDGVSGVGDGVPAALAIERIAPNPFNPRTTIAFSVRQTGPVRLEIYDVTGRRIKTLVDESLPAGPFNAVWRGRDESGRPAASGTYFARLSDGQGVVSRPLVLVK